MMLESAVDNNFTLVLAIRPLLEKYAEVFGSREPESVGLVEVSRFLNKYSSSDQRKSPALFWDSRWKDHYQKRYVRHEETKLPWEWAAGQPNRAVEQLFSDPGFRPARVMELGCGDGTNAVFMAKAGCAVTAVDISETAIGIAREKAREAGVTCDFRAQDIFSLESSCEGFDFLLDKGCFHHIPLVNVEKYHRLVSNSLRSGARFFLICHSYDAQIMGTFCQPFLGPLAKCVSQIVTRRNESNFTVREIRQTFSDAFEILEISQADRGDGLPNPLICDMQKR